VYAASVFQSFLTISGATSSDGAHTHTVTVTGTAATDGGTEARPEAYSFVMALKT